jgi:hypothetical protein
MKNLNIISKKSQSEVVTTVLLVLLSIVAVGIVISFVYPLVTNQISKSDCVNVLDQIEITNNQQYTCYNSSAKNLSVQIHAGDLQGKSSGFLISVGSGGGSSNYKINNSGIITNVTIRGGSNIPGKNEERTYVISSINSKPDYVNVYLILNNGNTCDSSSSYNSFVSC